MRVLLNVDGKGKSYFLANRTETYYSKLKAAYIDIQQNKKSEYLYVGFFTLCSATLEYSLNYILTNHCLTQFGLEKCKTYAEGYISLPLKKKLLITANVISYGSLTFNEMHPSAKALFEMITLRNRILHNKEFLTEVNIPVDKFWENDEFEFSIPLEENHIDTLTKERCLNFGKAIEDFKNYVMTPALTNSIQENEMLSK
ncbi:MAG: hypothetical protein QM764_07835 [Chitinophagaceae bacterium]